MKNELSYKIRIKNALNAIDYLENMLFNVTEIEKRFIIYFD